MYLGSTFEPLLLGHFIGDFPLQTNRVFQLKVGKPWGVVVHASIVGACETAMMAPYLGSGKVWGFLGLLTLAHLIQDKAKVIAQRDESRNNIWSFLSDQLLHIITAALISIGIEKTGAAPMMDALPAAAAAFYADHRLHLILSWFIVGTYASHILIAYLKKMLSPAKEFVLSTLFFKYVGIYERTLLAAAVWQGGWFWALAPAAVAPSLWFRTRGSRTGADLAWSVALGLLTGLALKSA